MKKKVLAMVFTLVLIVLVLPMGFHAEQTNDDCITFSSSASYSLSVNDKGWDGKMQYSTDKLTWSTWDGSAISAAEESGTYHLYVRGEGNTKICKNGNLQNIWELTTTEDGQTISCTGNIETLRGATGNDEASTPMADCCYYGMFYGCTSLVEAPALPATTLAGSCYSHMFSGCTSLTETPSLPATTLSSYCYSSMFFGCKSLKTAPALPATTLAEGCYYSMFAKCESLTKAPALPATTLMDYCYYGMFYGCTSLVKAPALPATTLAKFCYYNLFFGCKSLKTAPALPATTLAVGCYYDMFAKCESLTTAPALPATTLCDSSYSGMFKGCSSLTKAPKLPATALVERCYMSMFADCSSLTKAPELPATTLSDCCYMGMFEGCSSLTKVPKLPATALVESCYSSMFANCTALKCPANMSHVTSIEEIDKMYLNMVGPTANCCYNMYGGCTNLKIYTAPTEDCQTAWLCTLDNNITTTNWCEYMFSKTIGDVNSEKNGTPASQVTYYVLYDNDVPDTGDADAAIYAILLIASMLGICIFTGRKAKRTCV